MFEITLETPANKEMIIVLVIHTVSYVSEWYRELSSSMAALGSWAEKLNDQTGWAVRVAV